MPSIRIHDHLNAEILTASPQVNSGFGKYLKGVPAQLLAGVDVANEFRKALTLVNPGPRGFGLSFSNEVPLGKDNVPLTVSAGAKAMIGVYNRTGMLLFEDTFLGTPLKVPAGQAYVAFSFSPSLDVGVAPASGDLKFGFEAGTEADIRCYIPFDLTGSPVTLAEASKTVLENFAIPNTVDDLRNMKGLPTGAVACVSGHGHLEIGGSFDFTSVFNPLASVNTIARIGKLDIGGGASVSAGFQARVSGDFQIRVQKMDGNTIRLSYHEMPARDLDVTLTAKAGPAITVGDRDLLAMIFRGQGGLTGTSEEELVAAGISKPQLEKIKSAMRAGMSRQLELALSAQFSSMRQDDAAFLYEIDLAAIDAEGERAVAKALSGDLSGMNKLEPQLPGHGIRVLQSRLETLRKKKVSWRVNLVGIVNIVSMTELVRTGTVFHDEESGELLITDKVTTEHVGAVTDSRNLRKLLYESAMMTLSYKASGLDVNTDLKAVQSFFFFDKSANRQRMSDFLDAVAAVGLMDADDVETQLGSSDDFGKASLLLESTYDAAACERMFADSRGARDEDFYEEIGRRAMLALVQPRDPDSYRRIPLSDDNLWKQMKDTGQPGFRFILPPPITGGAAESIRLEVVRADYSLIVWWASAMANAAADLLSMREFLNGRDASKLSKDKEFLKKREQVEKSIVKSVRKNKSSFDDPWGLVALFLAALSTGEVSATVVSPKLTLLLPE